jgi:NADH-quinone oxidoreductase subunit H
MDFLTDSIAIPLIKIFIVFGALSAVVALMTLAERKIAAFIQVRLGPMRVGPHGILQPLADGIKLMLKEDILPAKADPWIFTLAPVVALVPAFIVFCVIPFGPPISVPDIRLFGYTLLTARQVTLQITDLNIGVLYVLSISSIGILGIILGGWASNSKYPLMGALRSAAQMVSYEVALGFAIMGVLMITGSLSLVDIINKQKEFGWWFVFLQPLGFILFLICGIAETNRAPFDLPEAESELVAGFHTEYSGFRFSLFFMAEYANMIAVSAMAVTLFFGGWLRPFPSIKALDFLDMPFFFFGPALAGIFWFAVKVVILLYCFLWFRWTWPRYRYDQLMKIGWQFLLPLAIGNLIVSAIIVMRVEVFEALKEAGGRLFAFFGLG